MRKMVVMFGFSAMAMGYGMGQTPMGISMVVTVLGVLGFIYSLQRIGKQLK